MFNWFKKQKPAEVTPPSMRDGIVAELSSVWNSWVNASRNMSQTFDSLSSMEKRLDYVARLILDEKNRMSPDAEYIENLEHLRDSMVESISTGKSELPKRVKAWVEMHNRLTELRRELDDYDRKEAEPVLTK